MQTEHLDMSFTPLTALVHFNYLASFNHCSQFSLGAMNFREKYQPAVGGACPEPLCVWLGFDFALPIMLMM